MNSVRECCRWLSVAVLFGCVSPPETLNQERLGKDRTECIRAARMAALMKASQRDAQSKTLVVDLAKMPPDNRSSDLFQHAIFDECMVNQGYPAGTQ